MNRIDYILGDFVKFPRTEILAVPPKDSSLEEQRHKNRKTKEYSPFKDIEIAPAKRRFAEKEKETLDFLTDELVTSEEVFEHRNRKLFFVKGSWQHLNVKQFVNRQQIASR